MRLRDHVAAAARTLADAGVPSPARDARELAAFALGEPRFPVPEPDHLPDGFTDDFYEAVARRAAREPLQHILGYTVFRQVTLLVDPAVFIPRPETEVVAGIAIDEAARLVAAGHDPLVVDMCSGSGAIAASVSVEVRAATVVAIDASADAVRMTKANIAATGRLGSRVDQADVRDSSTLADLDGSVDVVVANPPYIPPGAVPVDPEVRDHDPALALYGGGDDGLDIPRAVIVAAARLLRPGGLLVMEHADVQGEATRRAALDAGVFENVETRRDLTGRDRLLVARRQ